MPEHKPSAPPRHALENEAQGIGRAAIDVHFVVDVGTGRSARGTDQPDHLAAADLLADPGVDSRHVAVAGAVAETVGNEDRLAT